MKPAILVPTLLILAAFAPRVMNAEPLGEVESINPPTTNSVSTNAPQGESATAPTLPVGPFDQMDLETLRTTVAKLEKELKQKIESADENTDLNADDGEIVQLRDRLILASGILRTKEAEHRQNERAKWQSLLEEVSLKLTSMRQERHGILLKIYQDAKKQYDAEHINFDRVLDAEQDLADAEFDLQGRNAYKSRIQRLFQWQEALAASARTDEEREKDYLKLKSRYLKTYIDYLEGSEESYRQILEGYQD